MDCRFLLVVTSPGKLPSSLFLHGKTKFIIPWQVFPSPVYPALQVQIYDPRVLEQLALMSHTGVEAPHSSMSRTTNILIDEKKYWRAFTQALTCDVEGTHSFVTWVFFHFQIYLFCPGLILISRLIFHQSPHLWLNMKRLSHLSNNHKLTYQRVQLNNSRRLYNWLNSPLVSILQ